MANRPTMHREALIARNYHIQNVNSAESVTYALEFSSKKAEISYSCAHQSFMKNCQQKVRGAHF